ncbi:TPA: restriction endonuclease subunit S [Photobacterium damselae]
MSKAALSGKYAAYPEYKDSGVEWVGSIPSTWEMWKLSHAYELIGSGTTPTSNNEKWFQGDIPWITTGELRENIITDTTKKVSPLTIETFTALKIYPKGSIAIAMYGATIGRLGILGVDATTNQACCVMTKSKVLKNKYLFYWLQAFKDDIVQLSSGGGQPNINQEKVAALKISAPVLKEQTQIAAFLDHETAKIDTLIEKQQQLIELLKEKRQAVISHAVTKGLNPDAPMKDSGVEWLGEVPEHWDVTPYKHLTNQITVGIVVTPAKYYVDTGIKCLRSLNVGQNEIKDNNWVYISNESNKTLKKTQVYTGDIVVVRSGQTGAAAEITEQYNGINCIDLIIIRKTKKLCSTFACFQLNSDFIRHQVSLGSEGAIQQHFNVEVANSLLMSLPPMKEQLAITSFLIKKENQFSTLLHAAEKQILLLQERRTALISAAVTGKIDVRNWVAPATSSDTNEVQQEVSV